MKKIIALLLALVMLMGLVACGGGADTPETDAPNISGEVVQTPAVEDDTPDDETEAPAEEDPYAALAGQTVKWWTYPYGEDEAKWPAVIEQFTEKTGINVELTVIPWGGEGAAKLAAGFLSGEGPDVLYMTAETAFDMIDGGHLADLSTVLKPETIENQMYAENTKTGGVQYMLPMGFGLGFRCIYWNHEICEAAGIDLENLPDTRQELVDAALAIKEAGLCEYPVLMPLSGGAEDVFSSILGNIWTGGGDFMIDGVPSFDSDVNLETMQWIYDLCYEHEVLSKDCNAMDSAAVCEQFALGKVGIMFANCSNDCLSRSTAHDLTVDDFSITMGVAVEEGGDIKTFSPIDMIAVNANSEVPEAAAAWMEFLVSDEGRAAWRAQFSPNGLPCNYTEDFEYTLGHPDLYDLAGLAGTNGRALPIGKGTQTMLDAMTANAQLMISGELTPEECVDVIQAACIAAQED